MILRDSRVDFDADVPLDAVHVLRVGAHAARLGSPIARDALVRIGGLGAVSWDQPTRDVFIELLAGGRGAIPVFESLDHVGALVRILPEWEHIRARPQRNAYHRFTVDRHSLEAVAECMALLEDESVDGAFDSQIANRARRDLLVLAALLHDVAKGRDGDHSVLGAEVARGVAVRIGLGAHDTDDLAWLVANHLLLADTATRRDLSDEATIARFGAAVGTVERLDLLFALTVGDSRATGPAVWNTSKAALSAALRPYGVAAGGQHR